MSETLSTWTDNTKVPLSLEAAGLVEGITACRLTWKAGSSTTLIELEVKDSGVSGQYIGAIAFLERQGTRQNSVSTSS